MSCIKGKLEVICGPMFSGKSEELMRRIRRAQIAQQKVIVFKPALDTRYAVEKIVSHSGSSYEAYPVDNAQALLDLTTQHNAHVIGIDEVQFFEPGVIAAICTLIDGGKRVLCAGLDLDFRGVPFGSIPTLLAIADTITKLSSICTACGNDAHFSQRLINDVPAKFHDPIIMVGAQESYQARCRSCFSIDQKPCW
jgi:thymidine kinase